MPIPSQPTNLFSRPFAADGTKQIIPDAQQIPGRASLADGFPSETQLPLNQGGIAPNRTDFNGILYMLSAAAFWQQSGGQWTYSQNLNYTPPSIVYHGEKLWWCLGQNGPETDAGVVAPGSNAAVWRDLFEALAVMGGKSTDQTPVGTVISYWGTRAPEGYFACSGGSFSATAYPKLRAVLGGSILPDLRGYFIRGYGGGVDPDGAARGIGGVQTDASRRIAGTLRNIGGGHYVTPEADGAFWAEWTQSQRLDSGGMGNVSTIHFDTARSVPTASENRPVNVCLLYCIKHD